MSLVVSVIFPSSAANPDTHTATAKDVDAARAELALLQKQLAEMKADAAGQSEPSEQQNDCSNRSDKKDA